MTTPVGASRTCLVICPGCGNDLDGDNFCSVHDCEWEDVAPLWCGQHAMLFSRCHEFGKTHVVPRADANAPSSGDGDS